MGIAEAPDAGAIAFLPLVGAVVGALAGTAGWAAALVLPHTVAVALSFGASIVLTGGLHVDGFLDTCDGVFASVPAERRLAILKDPHHGSFAIAGFGVLAALWLAAIWSIDPMRLPLALAFAAAAARWIVVGVAVAAGYGNAWTALPRGVHIAMGVLVLLLGWSYWGHAVVLVALWLPAFGAALWMRRRLGGRLTGDCLGFLIVGVEVAVLALLPLTSP